MRPGVCREGGVVKKPTRTEARVLGIYTALLWVFVLLVAPLTLTERQILTVAPFLAWAGILWVALLVGWSVRRAFGH